MNWDKFFSWFWIFNFSDIYLGSDSGSDKIYKMKYYKKIYSVFMSDLNWFEFIFIGSGLIYIFEFGLFV